MRLTARKILVVCSLILTLLRLNWSSIVAIFGNIREFLFQSDLGRYLTTVCNASTTFSTLGPIISSQFIFELSL